MDFRLVIQKQGRVGFRVAPVGLVVLATDRQFPVSLTHLNLVGNDTNGPFIFGRGYPADSRSGSIQCTHNLQTAHPLSADIIICRRG